MSGTPRTIRATVATALLLAAALASSPHVSQAKTPQDQLVIGLNMANMLGLDPGVFNQFEPSHVFANIYDQWVTSDPKDPTKLLPRAMAAWRMGDDGSITFTFREGMKFHSGRPVTLDDVIWSITRHLKMDKTGAADLKELGYTAQNIEANLQKVDERTLVLKAPTAISPALKILFFGKSWASILDRVEVEKNAVGSDYGEKWLTTNSAGSGPFKLNRWAPNDVAVLDRFDGYWAGAAKMRRVLVRHIPESQAMRLQLERGDVDVGYALAPPDLDALDRNPAVSVQPVRGGGQYYFSVNAADADLGKAPVRQALRWCIDFQGINSAIMKYYGRPWQRQVLPGLVGAMPDLDYKLDVARCRSELAAAGYPNGLKKSLRVLASPPFKEIATAVQATMAQAGVQIEILAGDGGQVYGNMRNRNFQMLVGRNGSGFLPDPHDTLQATAYNADNRLEAKLINSASWRASWYVPAVNKLIEQGLAERDPEKRAAIYREAQDRIEEAVPWMFVISERYDPVAIGKRVRNYIGSPTWTVNWAVVDKDP